MPGRGLLCVTFRSLRHGQLADLVELHRLQARICHWQRHAARLNPNLKLVFVVRCLADAN